jgi:hypothetical protein
VETREAIAMIVARLNQKGDIGKSTLECCLSPANGP